MFRQKKYDKTKTKNDGVKTTKSVVGQNPQEIQEFCQTPTVRTTHASSTYKKRKDNPLPDGSLKKGSSLALTGRNITNPIKQFEIKWRRLDHQMTGGRVSDFNIRQ